MAGIAVKVEHVVMGVWQALREDLLRLEQSEPFVLVSYPDPRSAGASKPYSITLLAAAEQVAADLHAKYGDTVELRVGALPYPQRTGRTRSFRLAQPVADLSPSDVRVALDGPLIVRSGANASHGLHITNLTRTPFTVLTMGGAVACEVVNPATGTVVGGSTMASRAVLVSFSVAPGETTRVPIFVGTASFDPGLGYAVPPGQWGLRAILKLGQGEVRGQTTTRVMASPVLPFTITAN